MKVAVLGSGGREHALAWRLSTSPSVSRVYCIPGNAGTVGCAENVPVSISDTEAILRFVREQAVDFTVVGPETPLVEGIADVFEREGLLMFGPSRRAARLEGSKVFAKEFMQRHGIPTARSATFTTEEFEQANAYLRIHSYPTVIKADGLAAGKGVIICVDFEEAEATLRTLCKDKPFGTAGSKYVIEEYLNGEEVSVLAVCDGTSFVILPPAQDHKRIGENDTGKNTGGMGAYAPASIADDRLMELVRETIIRPVLTAMHEEEMPYRGCLYAGLMVVRGKPFVLEFNCRFGDPETQALMPLVEGDFARLLKSAASGSIDRSAIRISNASAVSVVLASGGYPDSFATGRPVRIDPKLAENKNVQIFYAGVSRRDSTLVTSGGRVLAVTATDRSGSLPKAIEAAYTAIPHISFEGMYYRRDIGKKGLGRAGTVNA